MWIPIVQKAKAQIDKFEVGLRWETAGKNDNPLWRLHPAMAVV